VDYDNKINGRSLGRAGKTKERGRGREEGGAEEDQKEKNQYTVVMPSAIDNTQSDKNLFFAPKRPLFFALRAARASFSSLEVIKIPHVLVF
jgi:hypothetical protein